MTAAEPNKPGATDPAGADPSMEDILASIRRILSEDEASADTTPPHEHAEASHVPRLQEVPPAHEAHAAPANSDNASASDTLVLDASMMVAEHDLPATPSTPFPVPMMNTQDQEPSPPAPATTLVAPSVAAAAASSVGSLARGIAADRAAQVHSNGPTLDDIVREELRPVLKQWLDAHLPGMVERLVRVELERVISRAAS